MKDQKHRQNDTGADDRTQQAVHSMTQWVNQRTAQHRRRRTVITMAGAAVAIALVGSLSNLSGMAREIDTDSLALQGRFEIEKRLPEGRAALQDLLEQEAPGLVGQGLAALLDSLPALRQRFVAGMTEELAGINADFEERAAGFLAEAIAEGKRQIDATDPDADNQLELVARAAAQRFQADFQQAAHDLYPHYAAEMTRLRADLEYLMETDPARLSPSDRNKRELIETVLLLVQRAQQQNI